MSDVRKSKDPYGYYGVYGSLAYDFRPVGNERAGEYGRFGERPLREPSRVKRHRSPALLIASALCAIILFSGLLSRSALVELSALTVEKQQEIEQLLHEQDTLKIAHSMAFRPEETERYAVEKLGMRKPGEGQIYYIDTSSPVCSDEQDKIQLSWSLWDMICEYFPG